MKIELDEKKEVPALSRILKEHRERVGKRRSLPPGRNLLDSYSEIELCDDLIPQLEPPAEEKASEPKKGSRGSSK